MRRFENYWLEEARWEEEQNLRRRERRKRTREERRARAREQMLTFVGVCLFILVALLATTVYAESRYEAKTEIAQSTDDGRLPGDDVPAEDEIQDFENEKIEAALLNRSHKLTDVTVTHYCPCQKCCGKPEGHPAYGITASGRQLIPGVSVGVDPSVIPLGSTMILDFGDGELQYCVADDTGSGVRGNHIDLAMADHQEALEMGVRTATVYWCEEGTA